MSDELFDASSNLSVWQGAVEIQAGGDTEVRVDGPIVTRDLESDDINDEDIHVRLSATVEDMFHDDVAGTVGITFDVETAERLATVLGEVAQADVEQFGEVVDDE